MACNRIAAEGGRELSEHEVVHYVESLWEPHVWFVSMHGVNEEIELTRAPCTIDRARAWVAKLCDDLGSRIVNTEYRQVA